ncbi:MAG: Asp-tRNA(Asn)/Glu-tRNA(Gln) amidotransferase GatCAB subunit [Candidatus Midichloriaceae bacterium]|nr:Asp-tRNA(Asn)/Glu-tRNA(Gln) amidotransferase GatCAB subunit [Candidatus Midichloriaceae bacterium]
MANLTDLTIKEALNLLKSRQISSVELTKAHIEKAKQHQDLNAFTQITEEHAIKQAEASDKRYADGTAGSIEGIGIGVKDLFCTKGFETSACSNILRGFIPPYESTVTQNMFNAGAVMVGKTNMDEFAMGSANTTSAYGPVISPLKRFGDENAKIVPGGSSGGSAAAVAANLCMGALGSDTGGSIRQPAAFVGIVGAKPTYGRCSRYGMISFASSLDQAGCFARTVEDTAMLLQSISGFDPKDSTSVKIETPNYSQDLNLGVKGLRVGIPKEYMVDGMPEEISKMWTDGANALKAQGAEIVEISLPHTKYSLPTYYIIAPAEASSNLARYDGVRFGNRVAANSMGINDMYEATRAAGFGEEVKRRLMIGTYVLSAGFYDAYYTKAQKVRNLIMQDFDKAFKKVDIILTPTAPSEAFAIGENTSDPVKMYLNDVFAVPASLAGLPCMSVPAAMSKNKLPLGLHLIANHFEEVLMFRVAAALERA